MSSSPRIRSVPGGFSRILVVELPAAAARMGSNLARLELNVMFEELLRRLPEIQLVGEPKRLRSNFINAIKYMPVKLGSR